MSKLTIVVKFEVIRALKKPTFWISIVALPVIIALYISLIYMSAQSQYELDNEQSSAKFSILIMDSSGLITDEVIDRSGASTTKDKASGIDKVKNGYVEAFIYLPDDIDSQTIEIYSKNINLTENDKYSSVVYALLKNSIKTSISNQEIAIINNKIDISQTNYENGEIVNPIGRAILPFLFLAVFYFIIIILANQMLASTTEEKENRVTEMLLTSIKAGSLIKGKIIGLIILGIIQILVIIIPIAIAYFFARQAVNLPDIVEFINIVEFDIEKFMIGLSLVIFGFILFTGLLIGIGAAVPTAKEANSFLTIVLIPMFLPFLAIMTIVSQPQTIIVQLFSYFPLTAPVTLMIRNAVGNLSSFEALLGITILALSGFIVISIAIRIFQFGTLEYSRTINPSSFIRNKFKNRG